MLLLTLRGTPTLYNGDELGLPDVPVPPERVVDADGRDPQRSPMPWEPGPGAGFTTGEPWLPMVRDADTRAFSVQRADPRSMLSLHRRLLRLRRDEPALIGGQWRLREAPDGVLAYDRILGDRHLVVVLNLGAGPVNVPVPGEWSLRLSTTLHRDGDRLRDAVSLEADEGVVLVPATDRATG
jgi:alpha-glucosidase